jgi:hypothetical protein
VRGGPLDAPLRGEGHLPGTQDDSPARSMHTHRGDEGATACREGCWVGCSTQASTGALLSEAFMRMLAVLMAAHC